ncbi:gamma-glutamyl-gamma-aminobutyrate hydrolase family protein [Microcoleus sp. FACHB-1515]|uniref:glutamine amidotransferase-related protein n=1 Tax=Cyanophyceae TaxID=3028117 RepID=UPI001682B158|nr:gamma-glutamyl-gamma-aminobutyrate hydrolase family protein [Microcoleus sp. FACHB-1515]MBD2089017.1 gamma-glutamyl-gamma-aminobutyrate hydrolase family protein [Microcoleus sp. FACHB-1515]
MSQILVIVHQENSNCGLVGQILEENGYELDVRRPCLSESLPDTLDDYAGAIVFGGPMSANDDQTLPFIRTELEWIERAIASGKPYLGICLGAQLLARSLGAKVRPHPQEIVEIGYVPIRPTVAAPDFPTTVYHWHQEGFELPQGAVLLAQSDEFPNQAFRYGDSVYGLQFHPEMNEMLLDRWTTNGIDQLTRPGARSRAEQFQDHARYGAAVEAWLRRFLPQWLQAKSLSDAA